MEMFAVFALGYAVARLQSKSTPLRLAVVSTILLGYLALKLAAVAAAHENSLYSLAGVDRSLRSEELRRLYRNLARDKHPDKNPGPNAEAEFIAFQKAFETLEDYGYRLRYELYGGWDEDAGLKSLLACLPFYCCGLVMAYCLTCDKVLTTQESLIAGRAAMLALVVLGSWEWKTKKHEQGPIIGSPWMPLTVYEQFEALRMLFYPVLLIIYSVSAHLQTRNATQKSSRRNKYALHRLIQELRSNTDAFRRLQNESESSSSDLDRAIVQNSRIGQLAAEQLASVGQKKSRWQTFISIGMFFAVWYSSGSATVVEEQQ